MFSSRFKTLLRHPMSFIYTNALFFSTKTKKNLVPRLMKDPKFTRTGIHKTHKKNQQYDLAQPHIANPELYYNQSVDKVIKRKEYRLRRKERLDKTEIILDSAQPSRSFNEILKDITNEDLIYEGSRRILYCIHELEKQHNDKLHDDTKDIIKSILPKIVDKMVEKPIRDFGVYVSLCHKYDVNDKQIWEKIKYNLIRFIKNKDYYGEEYVGDKRGKAEDNLAHIVNLIYQKSKINGVQLDDLYNHLEAHLIDKFDKFSNVQNLVIIFATMAKLPTINNVRLWEKFENLMTNKVSNMNIEDVISLTHAISKNKHSPKKLLGTLEERFVSLFESVENKQIAKIAIFGLSLANMKYTPTKFKDLAVKYIENNLNKLNNPIDVRFIASSFIYFGVKSKPIFSRIETLLRDQIQTVDLKELKHIVKSAKFNDFYPPAIYELISKRLNNLMETNSLTAEDAKYFLQNCKKWSINGIKYEKTETGTKLRDIAGIYQA